MKQDFSNAGSGCGTGAGGFQPGNTCARGGGQDFRERQMETPEFKAWFGDWQDPKAFSSKRDPSKTPVSYAIDENTKRPLVLYHSTVKDFNAFQAGLEGDVSFGLLGSFKTNRHAIFATPSKDFSQTFIAKKQNGRTLPIYMDMKAPMDLRRGADDVAEELESYGINPRWVRNVQHHWELFDGEDGKQFVEAAKKAGYDGAIFYEDDENREPVETYAVFEPTQIKSAIGNRGTFNPKDPHIGNESLANALSLSKPLPFGEAVDYVAAKHLLPTTLGSAELMKLAPAVRERAMFSARTANAWYLQKIKDVVDRTVGPSEAGGKPWTGVDAGSARAQLKRALKSIGYAPEPGKAGGIQDLSSDARLNLIVSTQVDMAHGYGQRLQMMQPDMQAMWPAWELVRQEERREPRDWPQRWAEAGGEFFPGVETDYTEGRMIALKGDPIWARISAFELPYPPFDFNSGMGLNEVDRDECVALGLIEDDWTPPGDAPEGVDPEDFAPGEASAEQFDPEVLEALVQSLGTGYKVAQGVLQMLNEALANDGENCGTGAGGFKPGNTCAIGGAAQQVDPKTVKGAARWVHRYAWDRTLKGLPFQVKWDRYLRQFKPTKPVKLYRFERADHDPSKAETASVPLQSWTYNREMVESIVEDTNSDPDAPQLVIKEYEFRPEQIYTDFTKFPKELRSAIEKEGGESEMDEVLVWKNYRSFTNEQPRDAAGRFAAVHPQGDPPGEPSGRIKHAVLVIGGKRYRGKSHLNAAMKYPGNMSQAKIEFEGFETESGHFLDRRQASDYTGVGDGYLVTHEIELTAHEGHLYTRDAVQAAGLKALCAT